MEVSRMRSVLVAVLLAIPLQLSAQQSPPPEATPEAAATPAPPQKCSPKIEEDRFSGKVSITVCRTPTSYEELQALRPCLFAEIEDGKPTIQMAFFSSGNDWRYLRFHETFLLADGKRVPTVKVDHDGDVHRGGVTETIIVTLDPAAVRTLGKAKVIEYKVGLDEGKATDEFVCEAAGFAEELQKRLSK
jgi:hypothetical protein